MNVNANDIQVGGNHYKKNDYQHWDLVPDTNMPYYLACSTKYVSRWRDKNGVQDLRKSIHYIGKSEERDIIMPNLTDHQSQLVDKFCDQLKEADGAVVRAICNNEFDEAIDRMVEMIDETESDPDYIKG